MRRFLTHVTYHLGDLVSRFDFVPGYFALGGYSLYNWLMTTSCDLDTGNWVWGEESMSN